MERRMSAIGAGIGTSFAKALAIAGGARGIQSLIDSATRIENALKVAGLEGDNLRAVYDRLFQSAQKNAAPIEAMVTLYGRLAQAQDSLNVSQNEMTNFVDKIGVALRVSGASATEASGALLQLSQALGAGIVRAEEYNSINEGARPILQAVAAGLKEAGGDVAKLRSLVIDGKVSSEAFFRAFEAGSVILEEKVAGAELTVSQHLVRLRNVLIDAAGDFNKGSGAAEAFGSMLSEVADIVSQTDFSKMGEEIAKYIGWVNDARIAVMSWLEAHGAALGRDLGLDSIGEMLTGGAAVRQLGPLTITSSKALQRRIDDAFGSAVETAGGLTERAIQDAYQRRGQSIADGKTRRLPETETKPSTVSLKDYDLPGKDKGAKKRADDYQRLSQRIAESTAALVAETEAQRQLNPLIDDYGYAVEKARAEQELLSAAKKAGLTITPALRSEIANLADQYALASAEAAKLAEEQDKARENAEKWLGVGQDMTKGFIDDLINGKPAAESFASAISKIGDALLDDVLSAISDIKNASGGGFLGFLGSLFGGGTNWGSLSASGKYLFDTGGYTGNGGKHEPKGVVHGGEYVFSKDAVQKAGVGNLEALHRSLKGYAMGGYVAPTTASMARPATASGPPQQVNIAIDVSGARGNTEIMQMVGEGVREGLRQYDREAGPSMVKRVVNDPRAVG
ncbi:tape measure protein [Neoaquamicrobium sediminum]